jgi:peptidyl-prolyl cis-trans isomerase SurA
VLDGASMPAWGRTRIASVFGAGALVVTLSLVAPRAAHAVVVERIVAVVGEQPILLSELKQRARPFLIRIYAEAQEKGFPNDAIRNEWIKRNEGDMYRELLGKLVDERLVTLAADKLNTQVSTKEVDDALKLRAADLGKSVSDLVEDANAQGLSELDYRDEVRRELLFSKMLETSVKQRVRVTDDDVIDYYKKIQMTERRQQNWRGSILVLELPSGEAGQAKRAFADAIVKATRGGADFGALARKYSIDASRITGGDLGWRNPIGFGKVADEAILRLDVGQISEPLVVGSTLMIVKVTQREKSQVPPLADVRDLVAARVREDKLQKQIRVWLDELKQGVYIDVRL